MELQKDALDLGIVTADGAAMLNFYRNVLGLAEAGAVQLPGVGTVTRLQCGRSIIRLLAPEQPAPTRAPGGGYAAATGLRYWTLTVTDLEAALATCRGAGCKVVVELVALRPGLRAAMIEDPDGNVIELMEAG